MIFIKHLIYCLAIVSVSQCQLLLSSLLRNTVTVMYGTPGTHIPFTKQYTIPVQTREKVLAVPPSPQNYHHINREKDNS